MQFFNSILNRRSAKVLLCCVLMILSLVAAMNLLGVFEPAHAGLNSVTWTTKGDFENNAVTVDATTTRMNVAVSGSSSGDDATATMSGPREFAVVSGGSAHSLVLKPGGIVWATGRNDYGQLGLDNTVTVNTWTETSMTGVVGVAAGGYHSLALRPDGTVWATGQNTYGQLGLGDNDDRDVWTKTSLTEVVAVAVGEWDSLALRSDGSVWGTGRNDAGQLGLGDNSNRSTWTQTSLSTVTAIASGTNHSVARKSDGTVWVTGYNWGGGLGLGDTTDRNTWTQSSVADAVAIAAGGNHTLALKSNGQVWSVGDNYHGQLGVGDWGDRLTFAQTTVGGVASIASGDIESLARKPDGTLWVCGDNQYGELGLGNYDWKNAFVQTPVSGIVAMDGGGSYSVRVHSLAVQSDGTVTVTGSNDFGQLGLGDNDMRTSWTNALTGAWANLAYPTPVTIGGPDQSDVGLRVDAGSGRKAKWSSVVFSADALAADQAIKFAVKTSDDGVTWSDPVGKDGAAIDWTSGTGNYLGQASGDSTAATAIQGVPASRFLDIVARLESDGSNTPALHDVTLDYETIDAPSGGDLSQHRSDNATIAAGGWTNETTVTLKAAGVQGVSDSTTLHAQFEMKPVGSPFDGTGLVDGSSVAVGQTSTAAASGLSVSSSYKWRARLVDQADRVSAWTEFAAGATAFSIEQSVPTGTIVVNGDATYATSVAATLALTAADTGGSGVSQMRISNDGIFDSEPWEDFATSKDWVLDSPDGTKTVSVFFKDGAGNVSDADAAAGNQPYADSIVLDRQSPSGTAAINDGATHTTSTAVTINSNVTDAVSGVAEMRFRNAGGAWTDWEDYDVARSFVLPEGDGRKTVEAEYKDRAGHVLALSDSIILDTVGPEGSFVLNNDDTYTASSIVTANSYIAGASQMRFNTGTGWSDWGPYMVNKTLALADEGTQTVQAEYRDMAGNVLALSDTIVVSFATTLSLEATQNSQAYGAVATLTAALTADGAPLPNRTDVVVYKSADGVAWSSDGTADWVPATSTYEATRAVTAKTVYQLRFTGGEAYLPSVSPDVTLTCRAWMSTPVTPSRVYRGSLFTTYGDLKPRHSGTTRLYFYRYYYGRWRLYAVVRASNTDYLDYTRYRLRWRLPYSGRWYVRAYHGDADHLATWSGIRYFLVR